MIVLDSSVLVGIFKGEPGTEELLDLLAREEWTIGAPTLVEARTWCTINLARRTSRWLEQLVDSVRGAITPFSRDMADASATAFERFGMGSGHPAGLNFGDCLAYGVSAVLQAPLLFKGGDFGLTDVMAHPASIRA